MRKGFPAYVDDRPSFLYRPSSTVPVVTTPTVPQVDQNGSAQQGQQNNNNKASSPFHDTLLEKQAFSAPTTHLQSNGAAEPTAAAECQPAESGQQANARAAYQ